MRNYPIISVFLLFVFILGVSDLFAKGPTFSKQAEDYRKIGYIAYTQGDLEKAYQFFKKAVYLNPEYAVVHNDLGIIYERRGLKDSALKEYLEAINLDPKYPPPYMNLALLYKELGNKGKAIFYLKERAKLGKRPDPWRKKAQQLLEVYESRLSPSSPQTKKELSEVKQAREIDTARLLMEESIKEKIASPQEEVSTVEEHLNSAKMYYEKANFTQALEELMTAQELEPDNVEIANYIKDCQDKMQIEDLYNQGKDALARGDFTLAIEKIKELFLLAPMYKDGEDILVSAEKEKFIYETKEKEEPIILHMP